MIYLVYHFQNLHAKLEKNDTKYDLEFRILRIRKMPWTTQSLNLTSDVEAWYTVRPYCEATESYRVALQPSELIQIARF